MGDATDFVERMDNLIAQVQGGTYRAEVIVDQIYAKYQELRDDLALHGGGQHHYTRDALYGQLPRLMQHFAARLITVDGSDIRGAVEAVAHDLVTGVYERAPFEFGDLKGSGSEHGYHDGVEFHHVPAGVHRLSADELRAKGHLRRLGFGNSASNDDVAAGLGAFG